MLCGGGNIYVWDQYRNTILTGERGAHSLLPHAGIVYISVWEVIARYIRVCTKIVS